MKKEIFTENAPKPIGPYSQAIQTGNLVFCSGQIPLDAASGSLVGEGDVVEQTKKVMANLSEVFKACGASFENVIKTTIFLKDMNDFPKVNETYATYFGEIAPARATVEVSRLPKDVLVEIDAVVALD